jgi:hypothetical protein
MLRRPEREPDANQYWQAATSDAEQVVRSRLLALATQSDSRAVPEPKPNPARSLKKRKSQSDGRSELRQPLAKALHAAFPLPVDGSFAKLLGIIDDRSAGRQSL